MATSPHQPESLSDKITRLKRDRDRKQALLEQIETIGVSSSGGGTATTYQDPFRLQEDIRWLNSQIESLTAQLNGDPIAPPSINLLQNKSEYV